MRRPLLTELRADGLSLRKIAETLTDDGVPMAKGGTWYASSVQSVLNSERMGQLVAA